jgi:autotransporter strand-loop-strand O-heptosyltransferase
MPDQEQRAISPKEPAVQGQELKPVQKPYMTFNPPPIALPTGIEGLTYDFNYGARVQVPKGDYRVRLIDNQAKVALYDAPASGTIVTSTKRYFVQFGIEVLEKKVVDGKDTYKVIFKHDYDARDKNVLMKFPDTAMGDILAWFPYAEEFRKQHGCKLFCAMNPKFSSILAPNYPKITFVETETRPDNLYASYYIGLFYPWENRDLQPVDWRVVGLQKHAAFLLGVEPMERRPILKPSGKPRRIKEKYVCIATQATAQCKYWNNAYGWLNTVEYLKKLGYRVLCIDRDRINISGIHGNAIPYGSEDFTGDLPLQDRIDLIYYADFFIGLTSGLSWLAWGTGKPVIMITGYTAPGTEFYTPYRVQHFHVCNSCCNDTRVEHKYGDFGSCPHHKGTDQEFECTRFISPEFVEATIDRVIKDFNL